MHSKYEWRCFRKLWTGHVRGRKCSVPKFGILPEYNNSGTALCKFTGDSRQQNGHCQFY
jgi:hypothetical protein